MPPDFFLMLSQNVPHTSGFFFGKESMWRLLGIFFFGLGAQAGPVPLDYLITRVKIHDGSENAPTRGNIGIRGDRIVGMGTFEISGHPKRIDGRGLVAAPGFI